MKRVLRYLIIGALGLFLFGCVPTISPDPDTDIVLTKGEQVTLEVVSFGQKQWKLSSNGGTPVIINGERSSSYVFDSADHPVGTYGIIVDVTLRSGTDSYEWTIIVNEAASTCTDSDNDGYAVEGGECGAIDCNDYNASVHPGATETGSDDPVCSDGVDNDCDGLVDAQEEGCQAVITCTDSDNDGYAVEGGECGAIDCNDYNASVHPDATETGSDDPVCSDGVDNDCDGLVDAQEEGCQVVITCTDSDNDGYAVEGGECGAIDCNDYNASVHPGATETDSDDPVCSDGLDNDCDGLVDAQEEGCKVIIPLCVVPAASSCEDFPAVDLTCTEVYENSATIPAGDLISQDPSSGSEIPCGSTVTLTISNGPQEGELITPDTPPASDVYFDMHSRQNVRTISRYIYGVNSHDFNQRPANLAFSRLGGNRLSAYNWETNASNAGSDWMHQNDSHLGGGETPGGAVTPFIDQAMANDAGFLVTVPMIGYVAADKNGGGDVNQTPDYLNTRFHPSYPSKDSAFQVTPDTSDHAVYQDEWIYFLQQKYPNATSDPEKPIFYCLDNEPALWYHTHARIHPDAITYAEMMQRTLDYSSAIKAVDADALIFGPVSYGWMGMFNLQLAPDANGRDFMDFYLKGLADAESTQGKRLVDVLDFHWYPEANGDGVRIINDNNQPGVVEARIQAPRSLWDDTYKENSWIANDALNGPIQLLPRLQSKIDALYPGTRMAITEYYYGGGDHISGGIAQADVLGIFGREGVFAATLWKIGYTDHRFIYGGFDMFRNFDGADGSFGELSIDASTSDIDQTSVYASLDSQDGDRIVIVCINKTNAEKSAGISVTHTRQFNQAEVYTLTNANSQPVSQGTIALSDTNAFQYMMPPMSVSTLVLKP